MSRAKHGKYFIECFDGVDVYELSVFKEMIKKGKKKSITLCEEKRDIGGPMWCKKFGVFIVRKCGKECALYKPCNGVSGRCKSLVNGFIGTGRVFLLTEEGLQSDNMNQ